MTEKDIDSVKPLGRYGVGVITEHPAGLLVIAAVIFLTLETIPGSLLFLVATLFAGCPFRILPLAAAPLEKYCFFSLCPLCSPCPLC